jgi:hypothetical protein
MRNNLTSTELNTVRRRPQRTRWYLAHHQPAVWSHLSLIGTPNNYPLSAIIVSGTSAGIRPGMTAWVGNNNASNLGRIRIRELPREGYSGGSLLPIAEAGSGLINWKDATTITVRDQFLPWTKHPRYDTAASQWRMDYDRAYVSSYDGMVQVNLGPPIVGFLKGGSYTASFIDERSYSWDASVNGRAWYFPNGSVSINQGTFANPELVTFTGASPNGSYFRCEHFTNIGTSAVGNRLIFLYEDESQLPRVSFGEVQGGYESGGYRAIVTAYGGTAQAIQENSEIVIFEQSSYNNIASSIGGNFPTRNNIIFRGWVIQGTLQKNPFTNSATFTAVTIDGVLNKTQSYDVFYAQTSPVPSASHWIGMPRLTMDRTAQAMLQFRSNAGELVDFQPASGLGLTNTILFQSLPRGTFWQQLRSNYIDKGMMGLLSADMQSNLYASADAEISGASAALPSLSLLNKDIMGTVGIEYDPYDRIAQTQMYAVASDVPLGAESPGTVAGYFGDLTEISRGLTVDNQETLITWAGNWRAKLNKKFPRVTVPTVGNYKIDPVPQQLMKLSMKSNQNALGIEWSGKNFYHKNLRMMYDSQKGYATAEFELSESVNGIGGSSITFPAIDDITPIPTPTPDPNPDPVTPGEGTGFGTVYVATSATLGRTRAFGAASPAWTDITPSGTPGILWDYILDPWSPATTGYLTTDAGIYRSTDLDQSSPSWELIVSAAAIQSASGLTSFARPAKIIGSININGYFAMFHTMTNAYSVYVTYTRNAFETWNTVQVFVGDSDSVWMGAADYVPHLVNGNVVLYTAHEAVGAATNSILRKSTNGGQSWATITGPSIPGASFSDDYSGIAAHCPYNDNTDGNVCYFALIDVNGSQWHYYAGKTEDGATITTISGGISIPFPSSRLAKRTGIESYTQNRLKSYRWLNSSLYISTDGFDTETNISTSGISGNVVASGGFPYNSDQFYAVTESGIFVSTDDGNTWADKTGDWAFGGFNTTGNGTGVIVPLWTE